MGRRKAWQPPLVEKLKADQQAAAPAKPQQVAAIKPELPPARSRFCVSLAAQTPLAHQDLAVEAESETDAIAKFNRANGIRGSRHKYTVTQPPDK